MEMLLMVAVVLIALAVVVQAGVLVAMYLMSRRIEDRANALMTDTRKLMGPLEAIMSDLKTVSSQLTETGKMAREQVYQIHGMVTETRDNIRGQMFEVREKIIDTVDEARDLLMRPIREYSAIATGIATGVRTFFSGKRTEPGTRKEHPAA
jgi:hypothetical protein